MIPVDDENALNDGERQNNEQLVPLRELIHEAAKRLCEKSGDCQYEVRRMQRQQLRRSRQLETGQPASWRVEIRGGTYQL